MRRYGFKINEFLGFLSGVACNAYYRTAMEMPIAHNVIHWALVGGIYVDYTG
jgi:hypothetical protein